MIPVSPRQRMPGRHYEHPFGTPDPRDRRAVHNRLETRVKIFTDVEGLKSAVGTELGTSEWLTIDQTRIDRFADATDDHQWIHIDRVRALTGPYGTTIAHGYLSLSLLPALAAQIYRVEEFRMTMNYGLDRVRFPAPVTCGSRVRSTVRLNDLKETESGVQLLLNHTMTTEHGARPAVVADQLRLLVV